MPLWFVLQCLASVREGFSEMDATEVCLAVFASVKDGFSETDATVVCLTVFG